ncbi:F-box/kelch-repeat protein At3g23880-like [Trifolium pratense]|uniref:F-box/kelch-repeat protein At3g23880-like n=1 Tax=Trifolium pratense TaxID=57577 RepID=UPI001E6959AA|nr:F-box/kelch-repeat protein At3g23880-like [Trifolium pratense]
MQCQETTDARMEKKKKTLPSLPEELIIQILLRLPVKSLICFKCVCKSWLSLISDPHFANSHFEITAATPTRRVLFIVQSRYVETESIDLEASLNSHSSSTSLYFNFMFYESGYDLEIKGSCRGFILLHGYFNIYLWNPSTGLHKKLPLSPYDGSKSNRDHFYGFGYDPSLDDYFLVSLSNDQKLAKTKHLEFFSLRANTWKEIEGNFPYINGSDENPKKIGSFFNGAIHWYAFRHDLRYDVIIAFDLMEEKLLEMRLPDDVDYESKNCDLWVFGEYLSLWVMDFDTYAIEIWVMKEYKVHSSWTKTLVLAIDGSGIHFHYFSLICSTKSGDIIGSDNGKRLVKYNDRGELLEYLPYSYSHVGYQTVMYTESLLSLPGDNEQA